jgi:two-component system cell cycle response regulator DivK
MNARSDPRQRKSRALRRRPRPLVLIVEDNSDTRALYAMYFVAKGFRVETATDGEDGIDKALDVNPDIVVMDLALPRLDGFEATRRLKADRRTAHIPIIACTAHAFGPPVQWALEAGCDSFVAKPCLPHHLVREVRKVLAQFGERRREA